MPSVEEFVAQPSLELLSAFTKDQLVAVAQHYRLTISSKEIKEKLFDTIKCQLIARSIVKEEVEEEHEDEDGGGDDCDNDSDDDGKVDVHLSEQRKERAATSSENVGDRQVEKLKGKRASRAIQVKELELELRKMQHELELQRMSNNHALAIKKLELERQPSPELPPRPVSPASPSSETKFDVCKNIRLVPPFIEKDVDKYFDHFERVAASLNWPKEVWTLLLQCVFPGKAREVFTALPVAEAKEYDTVKNTVLHVYELVPEAYRQRFRNAKKSDQQTFVEHAHEKERLFYRWCSARCVKTKEDLRELMLLEDFTNGLPETVAVHLKEHEVKTLEQAAVLVDKYMLTHKGMSDSHWPHGKGKLFMKSKPPSGGNSTQPTPQSASPNRPPVNTNVVCFYCRKVGHKVTDCLAHNKKGNNPKPSGLITSCGTGPVLLPKCKSKHAVVTSTGNEERGDYTPFITNGFVSVSGQSTVSFPIRILRDTGAAQSFLLSGVLPLSEKSTANYHVVIKGSEMTPMLVTSGTLGV
ncbi:hypothetical protein ACEWY4_006085 [Coilia grayii]|uniref:SCAN box domain-containing protein n=1 Tax=Coilia grayii TaxID=363190 RepID=A0ABD1KCP2_9TELE